MSAYLGYSTYSLEPYLFNGTFISRYLDCSGNSFYCARLTNGAFGS